MSHHGQQGHGLQAVPSRTDSRPEKGIRAAGHNDASPEVRSALAVLTDGLVEQIADRVAERVLAEIRDGAEPISPWLDVPGACAYLGFSKNVLDKLTAARAIPFRKKLNGQGRRFRRDELDAWMALTYPRVDLRADVEVLSAVSPANRRQGR